MPVYEKRFETTEYDVFAYTTVSQGILTSGDCIELVSPVYINFPKEFVLKGSKIFCKVKTRGSYGELRLIKIKRISRPSNGYAVLKKLIPSVFDVGFIRRINFQSYLYSNRDTIMRSSVRVLGKEVVNQINLWKRINWNYEQDPESPEDEIRDVSSDILLSDYW